MINQAAVEWGGGKGRELELNLQSLFFCCPAQFITYSFKKKNLFMLFNRFPWIIVCIGAEETFTYPSPQLLAHHLLLPTLESSPESTCRVKAMTAAPNPHGQPVDLQLPYAALPKRGAALMGSALNKNNHTTSDEAAISSFTKFPESRVKQRWHVAFSKSLWKKRKI